MRKSFEVVHTFYLPKEGMDIGTASLPAAASAAEDETAAPNSPIPQTAQIDSSAIEQLQQTIREQAELIQGMQSAMNELEDRLQRLERDLGV